MTPFVALLLIAPAADPDHVDRAYTLVKPKAIAETIADLYKRNAHDSRRVNGVLLRATPVVESKDGPFLLRLRWTLDYTGPRPPLTILRPTLDQSTFGQTVVEVYAEGVDKKVYRLGLWSRSPPGDAFPLTNREAFLKVEEGQPATGTITLFAGEITDAFPNEHPAAFPARPREVNVRINHKPDDRGNNFRTVEEVSDGLDGWTGELYSPLTQVELRKK
jgi:hypothetical protein